MVRWFAIVAVLVVAAPAAARATVPFRTVAKGNGASSKVSGKIAFRYDDERRWGAFWKRLAPGAKRPKVDFSKYMLLAVTQGRQPSGGHSVRISRIERTDDGWVVRVVETSPARGCHVTEAITRPYHVVRVPRSEEDVSFEFRRATRSC